jgi:hypothetical protein
MCSMCIGDELAEERKTKLCSCCWSAPETTNLHNTTHEHRVHDGSPSNIALRMPTECPAQALRMHLFTPTAAVTKQAASMLLNTRTWQDTRTPRHQATSIGKLHFLARPSSAKTAFETQSPEHQDLAPRTPLPSSSPQNTESPCCFSIKSAVRVKGWLKN